MKIVSIILFFSIGICFAQQGGWEKYYNNSGAIRAHDIKPTSDGGYIMTGFSNPSASFFGQDVMLMKINGAGEFEWSVNIDAADGSDHGYEVVETYSGGYALVGMASTPPSFDGGGIFVLSNSQGEIIKQNYFGGVVDGDRLHGLVQTPVDSGFVLVGISGSTPFLVRTDKYGDTLFTKRYDELIGVFQAVACSEDGAHFYLAGQTSNPKRGLIMKVDMQANEIWTLVADDAGVEELYSIHEFDGRLYCSGRSADINLIVPSEYHIRVVDASSGLPLNIFRYGDSNTGSFQSMVLSSNNNITLVGSKYFGSGESRLYVVKSDFEGNVIWEREFGNNYPETNSGRGICKGHDYGYVVCGHTTINGFSYVYVIKIDENGSVVSTNSFPMSPEVSVFPNPCSEVLKIQLGSFEGEKRITVFNSAGQAVYFAKVLENEHQIVDLDSWSSGVYMVHVEVDGHKVVRKVVK